jgi:hypothetical protein
VRQVLDRDRRPPGGGRRLAVHDAAPPGPEGRGGRGAPADHPRLEGRRQPVVLQPAAALQGREDRGGAAGTARRRRGDRHLRLRRRELVPLQRGCRQGHGDLQEGSGGRAVAGLRLHRLRWSWPRGSRLTGPTSKEGRTP